MRLIQAVKYWLEDRRRGVVLAPAEEIVHFLAVFRRAFLFIRACENDDRVGMVFGGWLADTLHNVSARLCHYDLGGWQDGRPTAFPQYVGQHAPEAVASVCSRIFAAEHDLTDLGLEPDLGDMDLAPAHKLRQ